MSRDGGKRVEGKRIFALMAASVSLIGCSGSSAPEETTTTSQVTTTSTTTTLPPLVSNLDIRIDPNSPDAKFAGPILETLEHIERKYPVKPGTVVILYSYGDESISWALETGKQTNCFGDTTADRLRNSNGWARSCGMAIRLDGKPNCDEVHFCRTRISTAAHEYFHVTHHQLLEELPENTALWMMEGVATYVGYAFTYFETPGELSKWHVEQLRKYLKDESRVPEVNITFQEMDKTWQDFDYATFAPIWFGSLYKRSFLAVTLLIDKYGEQAVLVEYFKNFAETRDHDAAFEMTFGITEDEFYAEFQPWIDSL
jgi:hypothetical protein